MFYLFYLLTCATPNNSHTPSSVQQVRLWSVPWYEHSPELHTLQNTLINEEGGLVHCLRQRRWVEFPSHFYQDWHKRDWNWGASKPKLAGQIIGNTCI